MAVVWETFAAACERPGEVLAEDLCQTEARDLQHISRVAVADRGNYIFPHQAFSTNLPMLAPALG